MWNCFNPFLHHVLRHIKHCNSPLRALRSDAGGSLVDPLLSVIELIKHYPAVQAVNGVTFQLHRGTCFGLLGPNGAGKTTTMEMLEGITPPTGGQIHYDGKPLDHHFRTHAGIMFQSTALQDFITVREALQLFSQLYPRTTPIEQLAEQCSLGEYLDRDTRKLSGGQ
ncbi:MAG: ATP-binding cassette domain-containing protein, partial [Gammaproteobacteria bacterium]|nr:ATP-binding cassette domain-containing protein [Gammaproteobacteria bacterium]